MARRPRLTDLIRIILSLKQLPRTHFFNDIRCLSSLPIARTSLRRYVRQMNAFKKSGQTNVRGALRHVDTVHGHSNTIVKLAYHINHTIFNAVNVVHSLIRANRSVLVLKQPKIKGAATLHRVTHILTSSLRGHIIVVSASGRVTNSNSVPRPTVNHTHQVRITHPRRRRQIVVRTIRGRVPRIVIVSRVKARLRTLTTQAVTRQKIRLMKATRNGHLRGLVGGPALSSLVNKVRSIALKSRRTHHQNDRGDILRHGTPPAFSVTVRVLRHRH